MVEVNFKKIMNKYLEERTAKMLTPVEEDFYPSLVKFLDDLASYAQKFKSEGHSEADIKDTITIIDRARSYAIELIKLRRRKIIVELYSAVLSSGAKPEVKIPNLTPEEKALCDSLVESAEKYNLVSIQKLLEAGRLPPEKVEIPETVKEEIEKEKEMPKVEVPIVVVSVIKNIEPMVDSAKNPWPALPSGSIVGLPLPMANTLVDEGKVLLLSKGK